MRESKNSGSYNTEILEEEKTQRNGENSVRTFKK